MQLIIVAVALLTTKAPPFVKAELLMKFRLTALKLVWVVIQIAPLTYCSLLYIAFLELGYEFLIMMEDYLLACTAELE